MLSQNTIFYILVLLVKCSDLISKINQKFPLTLLEPADNESNYVLVYNRTIMKNEPTNKINQKFPLTLLEPADNSLHSVLVYNGTIMKNKPTNKKKVRNK